MSRGFIGKCLIAVGLVSMISLHEHVWWWGFLFSLIAIGIDLVKYKED